MRLRYPQPANEDDFEIVCLRLLRRHWNCPFLQQYGRRGQRQHGIDLVDTSAEVPARAAQCKHRQLKLKPKEIREIVEKAKSYHPLDHLQILTSARRSTDAQDEVAAINEEHREASLFTVGLMAWEDIEQLLDEYPDVAELTQGIRSDVRDLTNAVSAFLPMVETISVGPSTDALDAEIDEARDLILHQNETDKARLLLERLRDRHWGTLSDWHKFRITTNLAASYYSDGDFYRAGRLYIEATPLLPNDEKALTNEAFGYSLIGDSAKAFELADSLRNRFPNAARIHMIWVNSAPPSFSASQLENQIPSHLAKDGDVAQALGLYALNEYKFEDAERLARVAVAALPKHPAAWRVLGMVITRGEYHRIKASSIELSEDMDRQRCREAEGYFSRAAELSDTPGAKNQRSEALLARGELRYLLGDEAAYWRDVEDARLAAPSNPAVVRAYAGLMQSHGDIDAAIESLRKLMQTPERDMTRPILAKALRDRGLPNDLAEAAGMFCDVTKSRIPMPPELRQLAIRSATECFELLGQWDDVHRFLEQLPSGTAPESFVATVHGLSYLAQGDKVKAAESAERALELLHLPTASPLDIRVTATLLSSLGQHKQSSLLWKQIYVPGKWGPDARHYLESLAQLEKHRDALDVCKDLKEAGVEDQSVFEYETNLLEMYNVEEAIQVYQDHLLKQPTDRKARLRLSLLGLRLGRIDLVNGSSDALPKVDEVSSREGHAVVGVLRMTGQLKEAVQFGYGLLRLHFKEPKAHLAFMSTLLPFGPEPELPQPESAGPGTAICYSEEGNSEERWAVIEDSSNPDLSRNEYSLNHELAVQLSGKKVGDTFILAAGTFQNRTGVVKQILNKYVFRFRDCMAEWQIRFPNEAGVEAVNLRKKTEGEKEEYDFAALFKALDLKAERQEKIIEIYKEHPVPLDTLGKQFGMTAFEAVGGLATYPEVEIRCCLGSAEDREKALSSLNAASTIVLDATALATLFNLNMTTVLRDWPCRVIVSQATFVELQTLVAKESLESGQKGGAFGKVGSQYTIVEDSPDAKKARLERLLSFVSLLESHCKISPCLELASLEPERRKELSEIFGQPGTESILLASNPAHVLWTDDLAVAGLAKSEFGVHRVWTQVALTWRAQLGTLDLDSLSGASAKLMGWGYFFTGVSAAMLIKSGNLANWNPDGWPLKQAIDAFSKPSMSLQDAGILAVGFLVNLYKECSIAELRRLVIIRLLERLSSKYDGMKLIEALEKSLAIIFGLNVLGAQDAEAVFKAWRASHGGIL